MFLNAGGQRMLEVAKIAKISNTDWTWSPKFADLDNDGWIDLFVANGMSRDFMNSDLHQGGSRGGEKWKDQPVLREKNLAFRNQDGLHFQNVSQAWGLDRLSASYGAAFGDLDRDGDLDLITTNFGEPVSIYQNQSERNRLVIKLVGSSSNRQGIGARVELTTSSGNQTRQLNTSQGFLSSNEPLVHFGLGNASIEQLVVHWPSGRRQTIMSSQLKPNQSVTIQEPTAKEIFTPAAPPSPRFRRSKTFTNYRHAERPFDDFEKQPLLPSKKSQLGPGIACGDLNEDGQDDFYLGGAAGVAGQIVLSNGQTTITVTPNGSIYEDMGALFFDADADGDLDLYVVSGGNEAAPNDESLRDRLYLRSQDKFEIAESQLPDLRDAGSCVCAADFDRDGDLDLFVGGYGVPWQYPKSAPSRILVNDNGHFQDATDRVSPELLDAELVTAGIWSDVNGDHWLDLVIAQEWGTIDVFLNEKGQLKKSAYTGVENQRGWWGGIAAGDVDGDGDIDFVVGNQGLNTKYHATEEHPAHLYVGDFDGTGKQRLVEAKYEAGILLPERGKSCSTAAIPILSERFKTYEAFAVAGLEEIYTPQTLKTAASLTANTLESGVLLNDGTGRFPIGYALPDLAQLAPVDGLVLGHFDGDGKLDLGL